MLELCNELKISVNELLSGEVLEKNNYNEKVEQNLIEMVKQKKESDKRLLIMKIVIGVLAIIFILWITAVIPKFIAKQVAIGYSKNINMSLYYKEIEYNKYFDVWNVVFIDDNNNTYNINIGSKYFPFKVTYDGVYQTTSINTINYNDPIPKREDTNNKPVNEIKDMTKDIMSEVKVIRSEIKWEVSNVNIKIKENTLTKEGAKIVITDKNEKPVSWGLNFALQKLGDNDIWVDMITKHTITWIEIAMQPNESGITEMQLDWSDMYGELNKGTYRVVKYSGLSTIYSEPFEIK